MGPVSLTEARERLGVLVRAAEAGQSTVITRRGKAVAMIVPAQEKCRHGLPDLTEFRRSIKLKGRSMSEELLAERRNARY